MYNGPKIPTEGIVFALDASSLRGVSGTGNTSYNGAPSAAKNIANRGENVSTVNGTRLTNVNYYTSFGIAYPEGNYGGAAANRQGLTAGFNVTSGGKTYDASRALHLWVWDNRTNTWVPDSFFNGLRLNGHCYDNWAGAETGWQNELNKFNADFINIRNSFPDSTWIVNGSHACQMFDSTTINNLISLGAPSGTISSWTDGSAGREFVLVGEIGLGSGNYYGWAYENYSVDPSAVAHLVFPLPLKGNKNSAFLFDGTDDYISLPTDLMETNGSYTLNAWLKPNGSSWGDNAIPLYNTYSNSSSVGFWHHFGLDNILRWRHAGSSTYTSGDLSGIGLVANTWQMTTITFDRANIRLYKNGTLTNSAAAGDFTRTSYGGARIGMLNYRSSAADYNWNGQIAIHTVYNRALSESEITQTFQSTRSRFGI
jgi:hypothetical protein